MSCIPESCNTKISHQLFDYKITFINSLRKNTNSKGDLNFVLETRFETIVLEISDIQNKPESKIYIIIYSGTVWFWLCRLFG